MHCSSCVQRSHIGDDVTKRKGTYLGGRSCAICSASIDHKRNGTKYCGSDCAKRAQQAAAKIDRAAEKAWLSEYKVPVPSLPEHVDLIIGGSANDWRSPSYLTARQRKERLIALLPENRIPAELSVPRAWFGIMRRIG